MPISSNAGVFVEKSGLFSDGLSGRLKNFFFFWNPGAAGYQAEALSDRYPAARAGFTFYKLVFAGIVISGFLSLRYFGQKPIAALWVFIFYFWAFHTLLFPYPRYTLPIIPLIILGSFFAFSRRKTEA